MENNTEELILDQPNKLISVVKRICDKLRSTMETTKYRDYVLGFLFYKYLSETMENSVADVKKEYKNIKQDQDYNKWKDYIIKNKTGFFIDYEYSFQNVVEKMNEGQDIIDMIIQAFMEIEQSSSGTESEGDFKGLFNEVKLDDSNLGKIQKEREETIRFIIKELSELSLTFNSDNSDIFGNAYEYLLSDFASDSGKKAGEFYTPSEVSNLLAKIATFGKDGFKSAYDPACGSGSLLLKLVQNVKSAGKLYGQEIKSSTFNLTRMNLFLRGLKYNQFDIREGDTLIDPKHKDLDLKFECIVANPPFSIKWSSDPFLLNDPRYNQNGSVLAPKSYADFAFLQHMLYNLDEKKGIIVSIFSLGVLQRERAEKQIRKFIVDNNYIDSIILLPNKMFYNTGINTCIIVARKNKKDDKVLFIDASNEFTSAPRQNKLSEENINKIFNVWKNKEEIKHFSKIVTKSEIIENDYLLSISRYVSTPEEQEEEIDIEQLEKDIADLDLEINKLNGTFEENFHNFKNLLQNKKKEF